jgi:predicted nucleic acid-binding protein
LIVVADAGPIIHLSLVGRLDLLPTLYGRVLVPSLVYAEVVREGEGLPGSEELRTADWIDVVEHDPAISLFRRLQRHLHNGEAAALAVAVSRGATLVLTDDRDARLAARGLSLAIRGTLGILAEAKRRDLVPALAPLLFELKTCGVWLSDDLISQVLREAGELSG